MKIGKSEAYLNPFFSEKVQFNFKIIHCFTL